MTTSDDDLNCFDHALTLADYAELIGDAIEEAEHNLDPDDFRKLRAAINHMVDPLADLVLDRGTPIVEREEPENEDDVHRDIGYSRR